MVAGGHFGWPKITFDRISRHFRSIPNFYFVLEISHKMAASVHFGWPKITFDRISGHFRSIPNFLFVGKFPPKWPPAAILDDRKSLSITFLAISDQYTTLIFFGIFSQNGRRWPFWMTENHFRSHISPFQINTQLSFLREISHKMAAGFWMTENHFRSHLSPFQINTQLLFCLNFFHKMAAGHHFRLRFSPFQINTQL